MNIWLVLESKDSSDSYSKASSVRDSKKGDNLIEKEDDSSKNLFRLYV